MDDNVNYLTTWEVSRVLKVTQETVRDNIKTGKLTAIKPGRQHLIPQSALDAYLQQKTASK
jgi:DNA binding domain, excisionase family